MKQRRVSKYGDEGELNNELSFLIACLVLYWMKEQGRPLADSRDPERLSACDEVSRHCELARAAQTKAWFADVIPKLMREAEAGFAHLPPAERERRLTRLRRSLESTPGGVWGKNLKVSPSRARKLYSHWFGKKRRQSLSNIGINLDLDRAPAHAADQIARIVRAARGELERRRRQRELANAPPL